MTGLASTVNGAVLSDDNAYRYRLWRVIGPQKRRACFVMLNPSTADADIDDPTIRRCMAFARREGCGRLDVVNLFAYRATRPEALRTVAEPVGPYNNHHIDATVSEADLLVCAWGASLTVWAWPRVLTVLPLLEGTPAWCLGTTGNGSPRHPLYVPRDAPLVRWVAS